MSFNFSGSGLANIDLKCVEIDGLETTFTSEIVLSNYFIFESLNPYAKPQDVLCHINVSHVLDSDTIAAYGQVEDVITPPVPPTLSPVSTNATNTYTLNSHIGTNTTYKWDFGNGDILWTNGTFNNRSMDYMYKEYGNYTIVVYIWNQVANSSLSFPITVMNDLGDLEFTAENFDTSFGEATNISFSLKIGTAVNIYIDYGYRTNPYDTNEATVKSPVALNMDVVGYALFGRGSYIFPARGTYTVVIHAENAVSKLEITKEVSVEAPVEGLEVSLMQELEGDVKKDFLEVNEKLTIITTKTKGDNVKYYYHVGDGRDVIVSDSPSITVQYPKWRVDPPYKIQVFAVNLLSNETVETEIAVQRTIQPLTGFKLLHGPENSTEQMQFVLDISTGDWFDCIIDWNDGSETELMTWEQYNASNPKGLLHHQFEAGEYEVKTNCSSRLYEIEAKTTAYSYTPVSFFEVDIYRACKFEAFQPGKGEFEDMYPIECPVMFYCAKQLGTNVTYEFDFGYQNADKVAQKASQWLEVSNETYHTFTLPEGSNNYKFNIKIKAKSVVGSVERIVKAHMLESVLNYSIGLREETIMIGQLANFTATINGDPYKPCFMVEWGDEFEKGNILYKPGVFGHPECTTIDLYAKCNYLGGFETNSPGKILPLVAYKYLDVIAYPVTVIARNPVSELSFTMAVKVNDMQCDPPVTTFDTVLAKSILLAKEKSPMRRCRKYNILTKVIRNCIKKPTTIMRSWALHRVSMFNDTERNEIKTNIIETFVIEGKENILFKFQ